MELGQSRCPTSRFKNAGWRALLALDEGECHGESYPGWPRNRSRALARRARPLCDAEGLAASDLHSINFLEDDVEVVIVRADGSRRHNFYPRAALALGRAPIRPSILPVVVPQKLPPSGHETEL